MPIEDLTECRRVAVHANEESDASVIENERLRSGAISAAARVLHRQFVRHLLLTGRKGVGKTTLVRQLAFLSASGEIPSLYGSRFLWIDCQNVGPEDSRACLESIFAAVMATERNGAAAPDARAVGPAAKRGQNQGGLVLCLDDLGALLKRTNGGTNKPLLRAMLSRSGVRLIGILSSWEYNDLIGGDADMADLFTRIEIDEPSEQTALAIARQHAAQLSREFGLRIDDRVVERTVALCSTFILSECHPAKSIHILRRVCEDADYDRSQLGQERTEITVEDVVRAIAEKTGIPPHTIAGESDEQDFEAAITDAVVGQDEAVRQVANELRLIKAGLAEPGKPAAVLLFAGMTGVGKTELAKRIAELYSTSRRLQVYTMGNFTEPHSVSGIIGVPPGYVGHEQGGRLINELNADPYSVFLLDEAERE